MPFAVVIHEKGGQPRRQDFDKNEVTIGRVQGNDIVLPKQNVSKKHSRIVVKDGKFIIVDLKSTNGTYVNGRKIASPMVIKETDKIYIGDFILSTEGAMDAPKEKEAEADVPKVDPPQKAPTPPVSPKVVPAPPAPIAPKNKAISPSGAATAVSYGSPSPTPTAPRPEVTATPTPEASPEASAPSFSPAASPENLSVGVTSANLDAFSRLLEQTRQRDVPLPTRWSVGDEAKSGSVEAIKKIASELLGLPNDEIVRLAAEIAGVGPIESYLSDPAVTAIFVDGPSSIRIDGDGATQVLEHGFSSRGALRMAATRLMAGCGQVIGESGCAKGVGNGLSIGYVEHGDTPYLSIERVGDQANHLEELVKMNILDEKMSEFLVTALALNRTVVLSSNDLATAQGLASALVETSWQGERVVVIDPSGQMDILGDCPHLDQETDIATLCRTASMLKAQHIVFNGVCGTELNEIIKTTNRLNGGALIIVKAYDAALAFEQLSCGLALAQASSRDVASQHIMNHIDAFAHIERAANGDERVTEILDTNGRRATLFSGEPLAEPVAAPAWLSKAAKDGYEVDLGIFD